MSIIFHRNKHAGTTFVLEESEMSPRDRALNALLSVIQNPKTTIIKQAHTSQTYGKLFSDEEILASWNKGYCKAFYNYFHSPCRCFEIYKANGEFIYVLYDFDSNLSKPLFDKVWDKLWNGHTTSVTFSTDILDELL